MLIYKFAKIVMKHDLSFLFVEYKDIRDWVTYICTLYKFSSRNTLRTDLYMFLMFKKKIFIGWVSRILQASALRSNLWTPKHQRLGYYSLAVNSLTVSEQYIMRYLLFNVCNAHLKVSFWLKTWFVGLEPW